MTERRTLCSMSMTYPSDLTDAEWECVQRYLPTLSRRGRPRTHPLRRILDAIFSVLRDFLCVALSPDQFPCLADSVLPLPAFPPQRHLAPALHSVAPGRARTGGPPPRSERGHHGQPKREDRRGVGHIRGYDAHKCVKGRKRHLLVDTLGLPIAWYVTPADLSNPRALDGYSAVWRSS